MTKRKGRRTWPEVVGPGAQEAAGAPYPHEYPQDPHPDCQDEFHGADGGRCPSCGWNPYVPPQAEP